MEFGIPETPTVVVCFLLFLVMVVRFLSRNHSSSVHLNSIPGPKKLPLIGNLHLLVNKPLLHRAFRDLSLKYGPLMKLQLGEVSYLIVSSPEYAKEVLRTHDTIFANRPQLFAAKVMSYDCVDIGAAPYGEHWRHMRKICTLELLSMRRVQSFRHIREEENLNLAKWIASKEGSVANVSGRVYLTAFDVITRSSIGNKTEGRVTITSAIKEVMELTSGFVIADLYPSLKLLPLISGIKFKVARIFQNTDTILESILNEHRVASKATLNRAEDLTDVLIKHQEDEDEVPLTSESIKGVLLDLFIAGSETSATVIEWALSEMVRNPSTMKRAQEEVRKVFDGKGYIDEDEFDALIYLKLVIRETLRLHPPHPLLVPRQSSQRCEINGHEIPAKTRVIVNAWAMGRDPKYWKDADKFIPERFADNSFDYKATNLEYMPFGAGRRICPGMSFGLANVEFTLAKLLYHFDWEMPNGIKNEDLDMAETFGTTVKRKNELHLIPIVKRNFGVAA